MIADPAWQAGQRGKQLLDQGRNAEAEAQLRRALRQYPDDASLHGALGYALMRQSRFEDANAAFRLAATKEQDTYWISQWKDLESSSHYWMQLKKADQALERRDISTARAIYQQARQQRPQDEFAVLGLPTWRSPRAIRPLLSGCTFRFGAWRRTTRVLCAA